VNTILEAIFLKEYAFY